MRPSPGSVTQSSRTSRGTARPWVFRGHLQRVRGQAPGPLPGGRLPDLLLPPVPRRRAQVSGWGPQATYVVIILYRLPGEVEHGARDYPLAEEVADFKVRGQGELGIFILRGARRHLVSVGTAPPLARPHPRLAGGAVSAGKTPSRHTAGRCGAQGRPEGNPQNARSAPPRAAVRGAGQVRNLGADSRGAKARAAEEETCDKDTRLTSDSPSPDAAKEDKHTSR